MTDKEIAIWNNLIAIFMNHKEGYDEHGVWQKLKYHYSFDALMPVVHKIYDITDEQVQAFEGLAIFEIGLPTPIETIYAEVINYINWYNENKNHEY